MLIIMVARVEVPILIRVPCIFQAVSTYYWNFKLLFTRADRLETFWDNLQLHRGACLFSYLIRFLDPYDPVYRTAVFRRRNNLLESVFHHHCELPAARAESLSCLLLKIPHSLLRKVGIVSASHRRLLLDIYSTWAADITICKH